LVHPKAISEAAISGAHTRDDISSTVSCSIVITCGTWRGTQTDWVHILHVKLDFW